MKFAKPKCPECGELARGTVETLAGCAELNIDEDGNAEYAGETDVWWDEQTTVTDRSGRANLICPNAHEWFSKDLDE